MSRVKRGEIDGEGMLLEGIAVDLREVSADGAARIVEENHHVPLSVQHAVHVLRRQDDLREEARSREHGSRGLDGLERAVDVEASDERRVFGVQHAHLARLEKRLVDSIEHDIDAVGQNLPLTPSLSRYILHHRVVQRAVQMLLPLSLHLLHHFSSLRLRRLRITALSFSLSPSRTAPPARPAPRPAHRARPARRPESGACPARR